MEDMKNVGTVLKYGNGLLLKHKFSNYNQRYAEIDSLKKKLQNNFLESSQDTSERENWNIDVNFLNNIFLLKIDNLFVQYLRHTDLQLDEIAVLIKKYKIFGG